MDVIGKIKTDSYKFTLEQVYGYTFCHVDIYKWSSSLYKEMLMDLDKIKEAVTGPYLCNIPKHEDKKIKLASMFGFQPVLENDDYMIMELL